MSWSTLEAAAPALARQGRERFEAAGVALLGALRPDGTPRISPVEPHLIAGELVFAVMGSPKWDDLKRDPRCVLHSAIADGSGRDPEFKVYGRALRTDDPGLVAAEDTWWAERPASRSRSSRSTSGRSCSSPGTRTSAGCEPQRWRPGEGATKAERHYP